MMCQDRMFSRRFLVCTILSLCVMFQPGFAAASSATIETDDTTNEIRTALLAEDWRVRDHAISSLENVTERFNDELSGLLIELLQKEVVRLEHSPLLLARDHAYRKYFSNVVTILSTNTSEKLDVLLVKLPYWEESIFRVLIMQGGENILPQLLLRLSRQPEQYQDMRSGILAMTYTHIAQQKYAPQDIRTLKDIYLSFLSDSAFQPNDSPQIRSAIKVHAIIGLGVIGEEDVLPLLKPLLADSYCKENVFYDPATGLQKKSQGMRYCPVQEEAKRVIERLEKREKLRLDDLFQGED